MKRFLSRLLLPLVASVTTLSAQEAWLLEMPNKYSDYLIQKSIAGDDDTVAGIVAKLPKLIEQKKIREIDLIKWKAEGGKINKRQEVTEAGRVFKLGARYHSISGTKPDYRKLKTTTLPTQQSIDLSTYGLLPRAWVPTFAHRAEKVTLVVLERHAESPTATVSLGHLRQLEYDAGSAKETISWYSADPLDAKSLYYTSEQALKANPKVKFITRMFTEVKKEGNSLLRIEASSGDPKAGTEIALHHNQANFKGHDQKTGPLKKETIKISDGSVTQDGEVGAWTLILKADNQE